MTIQIDSSRDAKLSEFGKATLNDRYLLEGESYQDMFARVSKAFADDDAHGQRIYDYMSKLWFMPATPVLSNGGTKRGLPISCFLNETKDSLQGIVDLWNENVWLAARGGGIGSYWGNVRSIGEKVGRNGKTSGIVPFIRVMDSSPTRSPVNKERMCASRVEALPPDFAAKASISPQDTHTGSRWRTVSVPFPSADGTVSKNALMRASPDAGVVMR